MFVLLLVAELRDDLAARHSERVFHVAHDGAGVGVHDAPTEDEGGVVEGVVAEREGRRVGAGVRTEVGRVAEVAVEGRGVDVADLRRMSLGAVRGALVPREGFGGVEDRLLRGGEGGRGFHLGGRAGDDLVDGGEGAGDEGGASTSSLADDDDASSASAERTSVSPATDAASSSSREDATRVRGARRGAKRARATRGGAVEHRRQGAAPFATFASRAFATAGRSRKAHGRGFARAQLRDANAVPRISDEVGTHARALKRRAFQRGVRAGGRRAKRALANVPSRAGRRRDVFRHVVFLPRHRISREKS